jgi:hypothetical protein
MEAEEDAAAGGDGEVEERMVVKELVVVHQADQALPHDEPLHCSPVPELGQRAHILGSVAGRRVWDARDDARETCYDVGKGASLNMGSSNSGSSVQGSPREQRATC